MKKHVRIANVIPVFRALINERTRASKDLREKLEYDNWKSIIVWHDPIHDEIVFSENGSVCEMHGAKIWIDDHWECIKC